jgi:ribosomal protein S18 acetylase RimI-like enzyme
MGTVKAAGSHPPKHCRSGYSAASRYQSYEGMPETLRIATFSDTEAVTALTRAAYAKWVPVIGREPLPMKADHAAAIRDHRVDLLFAGPDLAALIETIRRDDDLLIENVAVAPAFQRLGYGRRLIGHAERMAAQARLTWVRLYTNSRFEENLRLYASLGYGVEREEALNGGTAIHMLKRVS